MGAYRERRKGIRTRPVSVAMDEKSDALVREAAKDQGISYSAVLCALIVDACERDGDLRAAVERMLNSDSEAAWYN